MAGRYSTADAFVVTLGGLSRWIWAGLVHTCSGSRSDWTGWGDISLVSWRARFPLWCRRGPHRCRLELGTLESESLISGAVGLPTLPCWLSDFRGSKRSSCFASNPETVHTICMYFIFNIWIFFSNTCFNSSSKYNISFN